jgi:hypothetical protein
MSPEVQKIVAVVAGIVVVVLVALLLRRRLVVRAGDRSIETGYAHPEGSSMSMKASGVGSSITRSKQVGGSGAADRMQMDARHGAFIDDAEQRSGAPAPPPAASPPSSDPRARGDPAAP